MPIGAQSKGKSAMGFQTENESGTYSSIYGESTDAKGSAKGQVSEEKEDDAMMECGMKMADGGKEEKKGR